MASPRLQAALDYMWLQRLELPLVLEQTTVLFLVPSVTFAQGENGQHIRPGMGEKATSPRKNIYFIMYFIIYTLTPYNSP